MKGRIVRDRPPVNIHPLDGDRPFLSFSIRGRVRSLLSSLDEDSLPLGYWPGYSRGIINASRVSDCTFEGIPE